MWKFTNFLTALLVLGIILILGSRNRRAIKFRFIVQLMFTEILLAYLLLRSNANLGFIHNISFIFDKILNFAREGTQFLFGALVQENQFIFFFNVLMPIVLISTLIGILQYIRFLPLIIYGIGWLLSKISGMGKLESFNAVSSLILGQSENFLAYKNILGQISDKQMYTMAATSMSTVSLGIIGAYMQIIDLKYIIAGLTLNMFSTFIVLNILNPYDQLKEVCFETIGFNSNYKQSFFEILSEYILDGFKVAIIVGAIIMGFISLIAVVNYICSIIFGINFQVILGYVFCPIAWLLGIPRPDILKAGSIMATKLVSNEFVAMMYLKEQMNNLSSYTVCVLSIFLVSFANFSSIGVLGGAVRALNIEKGNFISRNGFHIIFGATMVSFLSALIASLVIS